MCEPICNPPCGNGTCTKSLSCECDAGYNLEHNTNNTYACVPMCSRHCTHGKCITPGVCTCDEGYSSNDNITCTPICNIPCRKGSHCVKPDECACLPGYHETITFYHPLYIKEWKPVPVNKQYNMIISQTRINISQYFCLYIVLSTLNATSYIFECHRIKMTITSERNVKNENEKLHSAYQMRYNNNIFLSY